MSLTRMRNIMLSVGALLGSLCLLAALAGVLFGVKPLMFKSGSMEPTISTGGLALSIPVDAADIYVGDIVSTENSTGTRITHRVAAVEPADGYTELTLRGDANDVADAETYAVTEVDRVFWSAPLLGYVVAWLSSPVALFLGGLLTAYLLYLAFGGERSARDESRTGVAAVERSRRRRRRSGRQTQNRSLRRGIGLAVTAAVILTGAGLHGGDPARAVFEDSAKASATVKAGTLPGPEVLCIDVAGGVELSWRYDEYPVPPTFTVTWRKPGAPSWTKLSELQSARKITVYAKSLMETSLLSAGYYTTVEFRVEAHSRNWFSPYGTRNATYYEPLSALGIPLGTPSLKCA